MLEGATNEAFTVYVEAFVEVWLMSSTLILSSSSD